MRIGFITGSITRIGSGRTEAVPLARAFARLGCSVYGLETSRFSHGRTDVDSLEVQFEPLAPYLARRPVQVMRDLYHRCSMSPCTTRSNGLRPAEIAEGDALLALGNRLAIDIVYAFHNVNVARILRGWPHPSRLLVINLIGFGIDPSRGGSADTFPLQRLIFQRPHWDLHITATRFEFEQYCDVYDRLGISRKKLMYLPHSYDEELFRPPADSVGCVQVTNDRCVKTVLYPVNVYPRKNIELAIDVIAALNADVDCNLVVTGSIWDQRYLSSLLQHARDRGVAGKVEFLGGVSVGRLAQLYRQADVTIYTSHQETFGHGIVESLGCGTPVVGPDWIIPCREVISGSRGGSTAPKDAHAFAAAVCDAFSAAHEPESIATCARARYGNTAIAERFLERCRDIRAEKAGQRMTLASIDWKGLYQDAGDLL